MRVRQCLLIAVSGVRVHSDRLRRTGLTLPGFVERSRVIASLPSLGLLTLAARCPENWEPVYREIDELDGGEVDAILAEPPDLGAVIATPVWWLGYGIAIWRRWRPRRTGL